MANAPDSESGDFVGSNPTGAVVVKEKTYARWSASNNFT